MLRKTVITAAIVIGFFGLLCPGQTNFCRADLFMPDGYSKKPIIWSPDHRKHVRLWSTPENTEANEGVFSLSIYSGHHLLRTITLKDLSAGTFVKWSTDSKAFYVMWSNGGAIGGYDVRVFMVADDRVNESPAPRRVAATFAKRQHCEMRGENLIAIRWMNGAAELLLQAEVYPTSDCGPDAGFSAGYLADVADGKILKRYTSEQMASLGNGCPSDAFPTAFTTQQQVDDLQESRKPGPR